MTDRYRQGVAILAELGALTETTANRVAEVTPDFARMAIEFSYGDVFARPGLDLPARELAAVAALAAQGTAPQLRIHVAAALRLGWTREQLIEVLIQTAVFAGLPRAINAIAECHDMLSTSGGGCSPSQSSGLGDGH